ncbi:unnamed protein product [marine sediment metagenome]|uniref:Uncharacterized protein n=1 Tax=marine sediment metagenome TaxID=412755 RepID=X0WW00_9ZZZZ
MKDVLDFAKKHWYPIVATLTLFLIAIEVLGLWAGFGVPILSGIGYGIKTKLL